MSTLSVTTITTANGSTDLSIDTGNSSGPGILVSANGLQMALQSNSTTNAVTVTATGNATFINSVTMGVNNTRLNFATKNSATFAYFIQQNDDNFVFYSSNTTYGGRAVFSIFANSDTSTFNLGTGVGLNVGGSNTLTLGTSSVGSANFANGYSRLPNGLLLQWGSQTATVNNATQATATFPVAFTNVFSVTATGVATTTITTTIGPVINSITTTAFTWKSLVGAAAAANTIYYFAIGT